MTSSTSMMCSCHSLCFVKLSGAGERKKRSRILSIYFISSHQSHTHYQKKTSPDHFHPIQSIQITDRALPHKLSQVNIIIQVEGPAYMQSTTIFQVKGAEHFLQPAYTHIYASHIMHMSRGDCSTQPILVTPSFPIISSQIFNAKLPKSYKNMIWTSYDIFTPFPLSSWDSEPTPPL